MALPLALLARCCIGGLIGAWDGTLGRFARPDAEEVSPPRLDPVNPAALHATAPRMRRPLTVSPQTKNLDFRGLGSSGLRSVRVAIPRVAASIPENRTEILGVRINPMEMCRLSAPQGRKSMLSDD